MVKTLILVCASTLGHDECSIETATAVVQGPAVTSVVTCGLHGQAFLAETALQGYLDGEHYLQLVCGPERAAQDTEAVAPAAGSGELAER